MHRCQIAGCGQCCAHCSSHLLTFSCWFRFFRRLTFSHLICPHRIAASFGSCSCHPIVTAVRVIPSHLNSSHVSLAFSTSPNLIQSHVFSPFSALLGWSQLFLSLLMSPEHFSSPSLDQSQAIFHIFDHVAFWNTFAGQKDVCAKSHQALWQLSI